MSFYALSNWSSVRFPRGRLPILSPNTFTKHHVITFEPSIVEAPDSQGLLIRTIGDYLSALFVTTELVCSTLSVEKIYFKKDHVIKSDPEAIRAAKKSF